MEKRSAKQIDQWIAAGKDVVLYTSRQLEVGTNPESSLKINGVVSAFLVSIVNRLTVRPSFFIAKGGITSSDVASKGLLAEKAQILGQAIPGVPVWKLDEKSKFAEILYIVFPGNVGGESGLWKCGIDLNIIFEFGPKFISTSTPNTYVTCIELFTRQKRSLKKQRPSILLCLP